MKNSVANFCKFLFAATVTGVLLWLLYNAIVVTFVMILLRLVQY